jgi:hypothetical protein
MNNDFQRWNASMNNDFSGNGRVDNDFSSNLRVNEQRFQQQEPCASMNNDFSSSNPAAQ